MENKSGVSEPEFKRKKRSESVFESTSIVTFDIFVRSEGLQFIALAIYRLLDLNSLRNCLMVSREWNNLIQSDNRLWSVHLTSIKSMKLEGPSYQGIHKTRTLEEVYPDFTTIVDQLYHQKNLTDLVTLIIFLEEYIKIRNTKAIIPDGMQSPNEQLLSFALRKDRVDVFEILSRTSLQNVCSYSNMWTSIHLDRTRILEFFLNLKGNRKIDFNRMENNGCTPFHSACSSSSKDTVCLFLKYAHEAGIDLNIQLGTNNHFFHHMMTPLKNAFYLKEILPIPLFVRINAPVYLNFKNNLFVSKTFENKTENPFHLQGTTRNPQKSPQVVN